MRNKKVIAASATGIVILMGVLFASLKDSDTAKETEDLIIEQTSEVSTLPIPTESEKVVTEKENEKAVLERPTLPFQDELEKLSFIDDKVFTSDEEKEEFTGWLRNPEFIKSLGQRLNRPAFSLKERKDQNLALSLILKADKTLAREVVETVVKDTQIENDKLAIEERKQLAGTKGELIYQWTSLNPEDTQVIVGWLPGPVSQKIWLNVKHLQDSNVALGH